MKNVCLFIYSEPPNAPNHIYEIVFHFKFMKPTGFPPFGTFCLESSIQSQITARDERKEKRGERKEERGERREGREERKRERERERER